MEKILLKLKRFKNRKEIKAKKEVLDKFIKIRYDAYDLYGYLREIATEYSDVQQADELIRNMEQKIWDHCMVLEAITIYLGKDIEKLEN